MRYFFHVLLPVSLFFVVTLGASAQGIDPVRFVISPETPGPQELVRIEAQGVGSFLGDATITWRKNGVLELSGVGERVLTFTTGALGSRTIIGVTINSQSQGTITREFVFVPSLVNLVWEADTYTPPLHRGKALYSAGSALKVVAYPTIIIGGSRASVGSLSFQWSRNDEPVPAASGLGRSTFSFVGDQLQPEERVGVEIFIGAARVARGEVAIPVSEPLLLLYSRDPLRGVVYEQAFPQAITLTGREITVQAEPYYFSNAARNLGLLSYTWELNGQETTGPDAARGILTLRQEGGGSGSATLGVTAQNNNTDQLIQRALAGVQIFFGGQQAQTDPFTAALGAAVATFNRIAQTNFQTLPQYYGGQAAPQSGQPTNITNFSVPGATNLTGLQYVPLEPLSVFATGGYTSITDYLSAVFRLLIIGGAVFAVLMLTVGGITYMVSEIPGVKMHALGRARAALLGLGIILASWLILNTINPQLLNFNLILPQTQITGSRPPELKIGNNVEKINEAQIKSAFEYYSKNGGWLSAETYTDRGRGGIVFNNTDEYNSEVQKAIKDLQHQCNSVTVGDLGPAIGGAGVGAGIGLVTGPGAKILGALGFGVGYGATEAQAYLASVQRIPGDAVGFSSDRTVMVCAAHR